MTQLTFTPGQVKVISNLLEMVHQPGFAAHVIKGYAGTGKTTAIQEVVRTAPRSLRWAFTAPTNKATKVLKTMALEAKVLGGVKEIRTIYSLLGLKLSPTGQIRSLVSTDRETGIEEIDVLVVDEGSMVKDELFKKTLQRCKQLGIKLIFMGDPLQLPPVGEESSLVFSSELPTTELTEIVRQAAGNPIIEFTAEIRRCLTEGGSPRFYTAKSPNGNLYDMERAQWRQWMRMGFNSDRYMDVNDSFKIVAWRNRTVDDLNRVVRKVLYPETWVESYVAGERVLAASAVIDGPGGDITMTVDDTGVVDTMSLTPHPLYGQFMTYQLNIVLDSGDTATAYVVHPDSLVKFNRELSLRADEAHRNRSKWPSFWAFKDLFADIRPGHAITAHRSQGSTYENVFMDAGDILANANWNEGLKCLYVAASRASKNLMILR